MRRFLFQVFETTRRNERRHIFSPQAFSSSALNSSYCHSAHPRHPNRTASDASVYDFSPILIFHNIPWRVQDGGARYLHFFRHQLRALQFLGEDYISVAIARSPYHRSDIQFQIFLPQPQSTFVYKHCRDLYYHHYLCGKPYRTVLPETNMCKMQHRKANHRLYQSMR